MASPPNDLQDGDAPSIPSSPNAVLQDEDQLAALAALELQAPPRLNLAPHAPPRISPPNTALTAFLSMSGAFLPAELYPAALQGLLAHNAYLQQKLARQEAEAEVEFDLTAFEGEREHVLALLARVPSTPPDSSQQEGGGSSAEPEVGGILPELVDDVAPSPLPPTPPSPPSPSYSPSQATQPSSPFRPLLQKLDITESNFDLDSYNSDADAEGEPDPEVDVPEVIVEAPPSVPSSPLSTPPDSNLPSLPTIFPPAPSSPAPDIPLPPPPACKRPPLPARKRLPEPLAQRFTTPRNPTPVNPLRARLTSGPAAEGTTFTPTPPAPKRKKKPYRNPLIITYDKKRRGRARSGSKPKQPARRDIDYDVFVPEGQLSPRAVKRQRNRWRGWGLEVVPPDRD